LTTVLLAVSLLPAASSAEAFYPFDFLTRRTHSGFPELVSTADINGDGNQDAILYCSGQPSPIAIAFGHGDGTFDPDISSNVRDPTFGKACVFCDLNRDGKADFVLYSGTGLTVALGHGDGTFGPSINVPGDPSLTGGQIFAGDIDGDGWIDVATGPPGHLVIWRNHQDGTLEPYVTRDVGLTVTALQDLDGDGRLDLGGSQLDGTSTLRIAVAKGLGDGTFGASVLSAPGTPVAFGDADGDGLVDALVGPSGGPTSVCYGNGPDSFADAQVIGSFEPIAFADLTGDGRDEVVGLDYVDLFVVQVEADRTLGPTETTPEPGVYPIRKVADLNGDGRPDFAGSVDAFNLFSVFLSDGAGGLHSVPEYPTGARPTRVQLADLNRDGNLDVIHTNAIDGTISVRLGSGLGHFGGRIDFPAGTTPMALAVGELNRDGLLDVAAADSAANDVQVLIGDGAGGLGPPAPSATGAGPVDLTLADLNGDGVLDVVTANRTDQSISVLLGKGDGTFGAHSDFPLGMQPRRVALADLNGDGRLDAVALGTNRIAVLLGNGGGGFGPAALTVVNNATADNGIWGALSLRDWNGDGKIDVVAATLKRMTFLPGNGNGTFGPFQETLSLFGATDVAVDDVDRDGKPDLLIASDMANSGFNAGTLATYFGNGNGTFQWGTGYGADRYPSGVALGDLNGDGSADAVVVNASSNDLNVFLHEVNGPVPALASIASAEGLVDRVLLLWQGPPYLAASLYRSVASGAWTLVAPVVADASGRISYQDRDVVAGQSYSYRLGANVGAGEIFFGNVTVRTPMGATFALAGASPNPAHGAWSVAFSLPGAGPARLEVIDLAGRIVAQREVGRLGEGSHVLALPETQGVPAGVYFLRLSRAGVSKLTKVCAIR
jgi:hypothetical protein